MNLYELYTKKVLPLMIFNKPVIESIDKELPCYFMKRHSLSLINIKKERKVNSMIGNYKVITLCGSTKFKESFMREQARLTLEGNIVISVGLFGHTDMPGIMDTDIKTMLDDMHKRRIDMADEIFVINENGYIGESTKNEIEYAISKNKIVTYMEQK